MGHLDPGSTENSNSSIMKYLIIAAVIIASACAQPFTCPPAGNCDSAEGRNGTSGCKAFCAIDANNDNSVSRAEFETTINATYNENGEVTPEAFRTNFVGVTGLCDAEADAAFDFIAGGDTIVPQDIADLWNLFVTIFSDDGENVNRENWQESWNQFF